MTVTIMIGDCLEVLRTLPDESIDMVLADPPYGTTRCKWDSIIPLEPMWEQLNRVSKRCGAMVILGGEPFSSALRMSNANYRYDWIVEKSSPTGHLNAKKQPMRAYINACVFYRKQPTYNPQKTQGHERKVSTAEHKRGSKKTEVYGHFGDSSYDSTGRYPRNVIRFKWDTQKLALHPTQKPVALMEYLIKTYTNEGDVVLDFAMGSGTTGVAAKRLGRPFIGIEIDPEYAEMARKRIIDTVKEDAGWTADIAMPDSEDEIKQMGLFD